MSDTIRVGVLGSEGKVGQAIVAAVEAADPDMSLMRHVDTCSRRIDAVSDSIRYNAAKIRKATIVFWNALG